MSFDPERWLQVADVCCINIPQVDSEALLRTAANRAYYAALLSVRRRIEAAQGSGAVPPSGTHAAILQALRMHDGVFRQIYHELRTLQNHRNQADYELTTEPPARTEVLKLIAVSRRLIRNRILPARDEEYRTLVVPRRSS